MSSSSDPPISCYCSSTLPLPRTPTFWLMSTSTAESTIYRRPTCLCGLRAMKVQSRTSKNPGRWFYSCGSPYDCIRCGFFKWVDDHPHVGNTPSTCPTLINMMEPTLTDSRMVGLEQRMSALENRFRFVFLCCFIIVVMGIYFL